jgi:hypothetical protein
VTERGRLLALSLAFAWLLLPAWARAIEYEVFIDVDDEEDLYDLLATEQISERTFADLVELLRRGTDLNTATREELYALPNLRYEDVDAILAHRERMGVIADPRELVSAGVLSRRKLASIAAFVVAREEEEAKRPATHGFVRYRTVWTAVDRRAPPMALQARVATLRHFTVGAAGLLDRDRIAPVMWDPNRDAFVTDGRRVRPRLPKYFAVWETPRWGIVAGTYTIGFGQRLVFDNSGRYTPNGFFLDDTLVRGSDLSLRCRESMGELTETPCPSDGPRTYGTPDYSAPERLRGLAAGAKHVALPVGWLQAYAFFSVQDRSVYQYEVWNRDACSDPRISAEVAPECAAPAVYRRGPDRLHPAPALAYATLPAMVREIVGGGNFGWWYDARTHVGVTGYGATADWLVDGVDLSFQESASTPYGGPWGAVGVDASWGRGWSDLFVELAHGFDSMRPGGGGPAAIVRHTASWRAHELEISARYYDGKFSNPFARPISASDELDGLRARDEAGGRLRYAGQVAEILMLRALVDAWTELGHPAPELRASGRADVQALPWLRPGVWAQYQSRNLGATGRDRCFDVGSELERTDLFGVELPADDACSGERVEAGGRLRFDPHERVDFDLQYRHDFTDDAAYADRVRQGSAVAILFATTPVDPLRLRLRLRWDNDDIHDAARLPHTLWSWIEATWRVRPWFQPSLRYDVRAWLDRRESTSLRRPNPEHWIHLQLESRF